MPADPDVSLVMSAWEPDVEWLSAAIESALDERGCEIELILVDDGCTTPLEGLLRHVVDDRLRIIRTAHEGPYEARNVGMAAARGRYIRFVDSDDVLTPGSTSRLLRTAAGHDDVIPYGITLVCDESLNPTGSLVSTITGRADIACLLSGFESSHESMLFPRHVLEATGGWDPSFSVMGDWDFTLRALEHASVRPDPTVVTHYRRHSGSFQSFSDVGDAERAWRSIVDRYFDRHPDRRNNRLHRKALAACHLNYARVYARSGDGARSVERLVRGAALDPRSGVQVAFDLVRRYARNQVKQARRNRPGRGSRDARP